MKGELQNANLWTGHGCCTQEITTGVITCKRPTNGQDS